MRPIPRWPSRRWPSSRNEAPSRWPIIELALVHRVGHLDLGEISVVVAVSCPHRHQAFEACRWLIDTLKEVVPIWKTGDAGPTAPRNGFTPAWAARDADMARYAASPRHAV